MADVNITVTEEATTVNVDAAYTDASLISFNPSGTNLNATNVESAIEEIETTRVAQAAAPTENVNEGDIWYDTDDDKVYVRDEDSWNEVITEISGNVDGGGFS